MFRKFTILSLLVISLMVLGACGGGSDVETPAEAPARQPRPRPRRKHLLQPKNQKLPKKLKSLKPKR